MPNPTSPHPQVEGKIENKNQSYLQRHGRQGSERENTSFFRWQCPGTAPYHHFEIGCNQSSIPLLEKKDALGISETKHLCPGSCESNLK